jgi:transcriptional regulator with XRE-family HTH domain
MYKLKLMSENQIELERRASGLFRAQEQMLESLINMRKTKGLSQEEVGIRMGISQPAVAAFESYEANPTMSTIRRYALAVGAELSIKVRSLPEL